MRDELEEVLEKNEQTLSNRSIQEAGSALIQSEQHARGRQHFTFKRLLPPRMAAALELLTVDLSTDALVATLAFLTGLTGLLKIGTYVQSQVGYKVPMNLFFQTCKSKDTWRHFFTLGVTGAFWCRSTCCIVFIATFDAWNP